MVTTYSRSIDQHYQASRTVLKAREQEHVLRWFDELEPAQQTELLDDVQSIPWELIDPLIESHVLSTPAKFTPTDLKPAPVYPRTPDAQRETLYAEALEMGKQLLRAGKVAVVTVAGGQGTRLDYDGPKGEVVVTPAGGQSLFALFADMVKAARQRYDVDIPWYIMTSPSNHARTETYFQENNYFDLPGSDVRFFAQGILPAFDFNGRLLLAERHRLALAPDGHGGVLKALVASGSLADMQRRGCEIITYFQVDNPLVKPFDPLFLGLHAQTGSDMSTKVCSKADDHERVGNVCVHDDKLMVIEYSDFADEFATARNPDGSRAFDAGSLAIHLLDVWFVDRIVGGTFQLPLRRADKIVPFVDNSGIVQAPIEPNAVKLETFIFDALPLADSPLVFEVDRAEEFSPVKNFIGVDSLESSQRDQVYRACRWLESAGVVVPRKPDGTPDTTIAIAPSFALDAEDVQDKKDQLPALEPGATVYVS